MKQMVNQHDCRELHLLLLQLQQLQQSRLCLDCSDEPNQHHLMVVNAQKVMARQRLDELPFQQQQQMDQLMVAMRIQLVLADAREGLDLNGKKMMMKMRRR